MSTTSAEFELRADASKVSAQLQKLLAHQVENEKAFAKIAAASTATEKMVLQHLDRQEKGFQRTTLSVERYSQSQKSATEAAKTFGGGAVNSRMALTQLSYAADDFANTVGNMGLAGALRASSNNITTLVSAINPLAGIFTTVGIAAGAFLIPRLFQSGQAHDKAAEQAKKHADALKQIREEVDALGRSEQEREQRNFQKKIEEARSPLLDEGQKIAKDLAEVERLQQEWKAPTAADGAMANLDDAFALGGVKRRELAARKAAILARKGANQQALSDLGAERDRGLAAMKSRDDQAELAKIEAERRAKQSAENAAVAERESPAGRIKSKMEDIQRLQQERSLRYERRAIELEERAGGAKGAQAHKAIEAERKAMELERRKNDLELKESLDKLTAELRAINANNGKAPVARVGQR